MHTRSPDVWIGLTSLPTSAAGTDCLRQSRTYQPTRHSDWFKDRLSSQSETICCDSFLEIF